MKLEDFNTKNNINSNSHVIELGQRALDSLNFARKHLKSASRFGLFDSLGGSIFMSLGKYQKIQGFKTEFQLACDDLKAFENELLNIHYDFDINKRNKIIIIDTTCYHPHDFANCINKLINNSNVVILVRSHIKLDMLGLEYSFLGSVSYIIPDKISLKRFKYIKKLIKKNL